MMPYGAPCGDPCGSGMSCAMPCAMPVAMPCENRQGGLLAGLFAKIGLAGLAAFFFLLVWTIYVACTSLTDWWWVSDPSTGIHEGLWVICYGTNCLPNSEYLGGCFALLNVLRGFCILSIILGFFTMVLCIMLMLDFEGHICPAAILLAFLTMCCSIVPWTTFLGFVQQCVTGDYAYPSYYPYDYGYYPTIYGQGSAFPSVTKGSGWCLSIAAFVFAYVGMLLIFLSCHRRRHRLNARFRLRLRDGSDPAMGCGMPCAVPMGCPAYTCAPACCEVAQCGPVCDPCGAPATGMMTYPATPLATPAVATPMFPTCM